MRWVYGCCRVAECQNIHAAEVMFPDCLPGQGQPTYQGKLDGSRSLHARSPQEVCHTLSVAVETWMSQRIVLKEIRGRLSNLIIVMRRYYESITTSRSLRTWQHGSWPINLAYFPNDCKKEQDPIQNQVHDTLRVQIPKDEVYTLNHSHHSHDS